MTWHKLAMLKDIPVDAPLETGVGALPLALYREIGRASWRERVSVLV